MFGYTIFRQAQFVCRMISPTEAVLRDKSFASIQQRWAMGRASHNIGHNQSCFQKQ